MTLQTLPQFLQHYEVQAYDLLLIGDGSGQGRKRHANWAVVMIDRVRGTRHVMAGGCSHETVNWAELEPYLIALRYDFYEVQQGKLAETRKVVIFTDSEVTARIGRGDASPNNCH